MNNCLIDAILSEQVLSSKTTTSDNAFHIAFGVDKHYIRGMSITILSLIRNNPQINFIFHVFYSSITADDLCKLTQLVDENRTIIKLYHINQVIFKDLPTFAQFTNAIYNRLLIVNKLKNIADKVLYLDSDIICLGEISDIFNVNMGENIIAAVKDAEHEVIKQIKKLNLSNNGYFNSGVMYIDVQKWHENNISEKAFDLIVANYDKFTFPDQDALNVVLDNNILFINERWNYLLDLDKEVIPSNTILLHYAGRVKPWCKGYIHPENKHFIKYYKESPWKDVEFDKPTHYKHFKVLYKTSRKYGSFLNTIYWYIKYIQTRFNL